MKLVLVDIDGTLIPGPSTERRFYRYLRRRGEIDWSAAFRFAGFAARFLPRFGTGVLRKNKAYLAGLSVTRVETLAEEFVEQCVVDELFEPLCARLRRHRQRGHEVWLLSGTLEYIAHSIARQLRLENVVATRCQTEDQRLLAQPPEVHPYGQAKLALAGQLCEQRGASLADAIGYADSWADRFLLEQVGEAVAVMPDRKLRRRAARRGWEVLDRGAPSAE